MDAGAYVMFALGRLIVSKLIRLSFPIGSASKSLSCFPLSDVFWDDLYLVGMYLMDFSTCWFLSLLLLLIALWLLLSFNSYPFK